MKHPLCKIEEIPILGTKVVPFFGREVHVYHAEGRPRAAVSVCLHLGGQLEHKEGRFVCQWHGAEFGMDGHRLKGPAPSGARLMLLPTRIEDGILTYIWNE